MCAGEQVVDPVDEATIDERPEIVVTSGAAHPLDQATEAAD